MCKDKLMQAAGRMRQLDRGQGLLFAVPSELQSKISSGCTTQAPALQTQHLLGWVMQNTVDAVSDGLPEWAGQGGHYCTTRDAQDMLLDEALKLTDLYAAKITQETVFDSCRRFCSGLLPTQESS